MRQTKKLVWTVVALLVLTAAPLFMYGRSANAYKYISVRSVQVSSSIPNAIMSETFSFNLFSTDPVGSIAFEHCDNSPLIEVACNAPAGYDASARNLTAQTNNTGFLVDSTDSTSNRIVIS